MQLNPDILLRLNGIVVSQPLSQSVGRGFESQRKCWDISSYIYNNNHNFHIIMISFDITANPLEKSNCIPFGKCNLVR